VLVGVLVGVLVVIGMERERGPGARWDRGGNKVSVPNSALFLTSDSGWVP
jgi:hypothetical protein